MEEDFEKNFFYPLTGDTYSKVFLIMLASFTILDAVRGQLPEVNLLQLNPSFFLLFLFVSFFFLLVFSDFFCQLPGKNETRWKKGLKTGRKTSIGLIMKISLFLFSSCIFITSQGVVPVALDSFNSTGEKAIENFWSLGEVLVLQVTLLFFLSCFSQGPISYLRDLNNEDFIRSTPESWKSLAFIIILASGVLTPTVDGYTQISFSISILSLYIIVLNWSQKRVQLDLLNSP